MESSTAEDSKPTEDPRVKPEVEGTPSINSEISSLTDTLSQLAKLERIKECLWEQFPSLSIQQTLSQSSVPFLHVWKPISESSGVQGMPFLPCFHIIVTMTCDCGHSFLKKDSTLDHEHGSIALFQLHSFHGKVLQDELIPLKDCSGKRTEYKLVKRMSEDHLQLCRGVEQIDKSKLKPFLESYKLPILSKIRSVFLIEQFMGAVIFRSRLCEFAVDVSSKSSEDMDELTRCEECRAYQQSPNLSTDECLVSNDAKISHSSKQEDNVFLRVFEETSVSDMESMAVWQKVRKLYKEPESYSHSTKKKRKLMHLKINPPDDKLGTDISLKIKVEPDEENSKPTKRENSLHPSEGLGDHFLLGSDDVERALQGYENIKEEQEDEMEHDIEEHVIDEGGYVFPLQGFNVDPTPSPDKKKRGRPKKGEIRNKSHCTYGGNREKKKRGRKPKGDGLLAENFDETCCICLYKFKNLCNYRKDQERHEQALTDLKQPVMCPICKMQIGSKYLVTGHFNEMHGDQNVTCCCECLEVIPKGNRMLRRHILKFHHTASSSFVCPDCGLKCAGNVQFQIHMAVKHSSDRSFMCHQCGVGFAHLRRLKVHLRRAHQPRDLQCPHCDKKFETRHQASKHLHVHTGIKPYKCALCAYSSYRHDNVLSVHFVKTHGRKGTDADIITDMGERDRMAEIAFIEVEEMLKNRKMKRESDHI